MEAHYLPHLCKYSLDIVEFRFLPRLRQLGADAKEFFPHLQEHGDQIDTAVCMGLAFWNTLFSGDPEQLVYVFHIIEGLRQLSLICMCILWAIEFHFWIMPRGIPVAKWLAAFIGSLLLIKRIVISKLQELRQTFERLEVLKDPIPPPKMLILPRLCRVDKDPL